MRWFVHNYILFVRSYYAHSLLGFTIVLFGSQCAHQSFNDEKKLNKQRSDINIHAYRVNPKEIRRFKYITHTHPKRTHIIMKYFIFVHGRNLEWIFSHESILSPSTEFHAFYTKSFFFLKIRFNLSGEIALLTTRFCIIIIFFQQTVSCCMWWIFCLSVSRSFCVWNSMRIMYKFR